MQLTVVAPVPGANAAKGEIGGCADCRRVTEFPIGRKTAPVLVAAVVEIEQDGGRHDRHARRADGEAAALFLEPGLDAGGGIEAERRAAGQRDGVDAFDGLGRVEQRGLARARAAATQVDRADRRPIEDQRRRAGTEPHVLGVADLNSGNVGDEVAQIDPRKSDEAETICGPASIG